MVDLAVLPGFVAVILLFLAPPGPDMAYVLAAGLEGGRRSALRAILGIGTGMSVHAAAVVIGVASLVQAYPLLLDAVQAVGAAYLMWLGCVTLRGASRSAQGPGDPSSARPYLRGVLVSVSNPKVILFFLAVLPQFVGDARNVDLQLAMLGAVNVLVEVVLYGSIGVMAGVFRGRFTRSPQAGTALRRVAGGVYLALGVLVAADL
jgi:threonine/homoserine/homoserine lactone efflux protein